MYVLLMILNYLSLNLMDTSMDSITKGFIIFFVGVGVCALLFLPTLMLKILIALVAIFSALGVKLLFELNSDD